MTKKALTLSQNQEHNNKNMVRWLCREEIILCHKSDKFSQNQIEYEDVDDVYIVNSALDEYLSFSRMEKRKNLVVHSLANW